jgi:hypothetical protein
MTSPSIALTQQAAAELDDFGIFLQRSGDGTKNQALSGFGGGA